MEIDMTDKTHPDSGIPLTYGNYVSYEEHMQTLHAKIEELEAEPAKARKPCLHQISEPEGEYPPLHEPRHRGPAATGSYFDAFTSDQMRAYVDADRAMNALAMLAEAQSMPPVTAKGYSHAV